MHTKQTMEETTTTDDFGWDEEIHTVPVKDLATQLCLREHALVSAVRLCELRRCAWTRADRQSTAPNVLRAIAHANAVSAWAAALLLSRPSLRERVAALARIVELADECAARAGFGAVQALCAALEHPHVRRLQAMWAALPHAHRRRLRAARTLVAPDRNWRTYRRALRAAIAAAQAASTPVAVPAPVIVVPCLATHLTDILHIDEGNADRVRGAVNFRKARLLGAALAELRACQEAPVAPAVRADPALQRWLRRLRAPHDDAALDRLARNAFIADGEPSG